MPPSSPVRHPLFARLNARMERTETAEVRDQRRRLLGNLSGRVLELGAGTGVNFQYYPPEVTEVVAVEPEPFLREQAKRAGREADVAVTVLDAVADDLPIDDQSCDAAVACLVLCSVPDQAVALGELCRVVRPGGELRFYEHVLSGKPSIARAQRMVDRLFWPRAFGNCHTARDTAGAVAAAGFVVERSERLWEPPCALAVPVGTHVLGVARRP